MAWSVAYAASARRDLRDLDNAVLKRVLQKIDAIQANPLRSMKRLKGSKDWCLRVGDWRIVAQAEPTPQILTVKRIQHRSIVYD